MDIGGYDFILKAPADLPAGELILQSCRKHWPDCVFLDDPEEVVHDITDPQAWRLAAASHEFCLFRDRRSAQSWLDEGVTEENAGAMLHVIIGATPPDQANREITVVGHEPSGEVKEIIADLRTAVGPPALQDVKR
jgi:hypothetical protein